MPQPAIRLVVLNFNGGDHVLRCVEHLEALRWPQDRLDLVVVDNASTDGSVERIEAGHPRVRVIRSATNTGFPANNLGLRDLAGIDFVGLVNPDAFVEPDYLAPLVRALEADDRIGAACPKILLAPRFTDLEASMTARRVPGDERDLGVRWSGVRVDGVDVDRTAVFGPGFWNPETGGGSEPAFRWSAGECCLRVPLPEGGDPTARVEVRLTAPHPTEVVVRTGVAEERWAVGTSPEWFAIDAGGPTYDVVNNVGSRLVEGGWGADRGFLEPDRGQYDEPEEVFAWCGGAVLFRPAYLDDAGLFDERFFLYYEDTDLSWRGRSRGWRYVYEPASVVRHIHAASTVEGSATFNHYVERNRLLMLAKNAPPRYAARAIGRYVLSTASYARRDVVRPLLGAHRPSLRLVRARVRSFLSFTRLLPSVVAERRRAGRQPIHPEQVLGWEEPQ